MWNLVYEGNADSACFKKVVEDFNLDWNDSQGWLSPSNELKVYNFSGRLNGCEFDHLVQVEVYNDLL